MGRVELDNAKCFIDRLGNNLYILILEYNKNEIYIYRSHCKVRKPGGQQQEIICKQIIAEAGKQKITVSYTRANAEEVILEFEKCSDDELGSKFAIYRYIDKDARENNQDFKNMAIIVKPDALRHLLGTQYDINIMFLSLEGVREPIQYEGSIKYLYMNVLQRHVLNTFKKYIATDVDKEKWNKIDKDYFFECLEKVLGEHELGILYLYLYMSTTLRFGNIKECNDEGYILPPLPSDKTYQNLMERLLYGLYGKLFIIMKNKQKKLLKELGVINPSKEVHHDFFEDIREDEAYNDHIHEQVNKHIAKDQDWGNPGSKYELKKESQEKKEKQEGIVEKIKEVIDKISRQNLTLQFKVFSLIYVVFYMDKTLSMYEAEVKMNKYMRELNSITEYLEAIINQYRSFIGKISGELYSMIKNIKQSVVNTNSKSIYKDFKYTTIKKNYDNIVKNLKKIRNKLDEKIKEVNDEMKKLDDESEEKKALEKFIEELRHIKSEKVDALQGEIEDEKLEELLENINKLIGGGEKKKKYTSFSYLAYPVYQRVNSESKPEEEIQNLCGFIKKLIDEEEFKELTIGSDKEERITPGLHPGVFEELQKFLHKQLGITPISETAREASGKKSTAGTARKASGKFFKEGHASNVERILKEVMNFNKHLIDSVRRGDLEGVKLAIKLGADVNVRNVLGDTPLHKAAERGYYEIAELLIDKGADVNAEDRYGITPLHEAARNGHYQIAKLLIDNGADVNVKDDVDETPLHKAAWNGHYQVAKLLIDKGAEVNVKDRYGETPLHKAAERGYYQIAKLLIDNGADVNAEDENWNTPLHRAADEGHYEIAELLIDKGADVNAKDISYQTPLYEAARNGHYQVAKLLIDKGAEVNVRDDFGDTPLNLAEKSGRSEIVKLLEKQSKKAYRRTTKQKITDPNKLLLISAKSGNLEGVNQAIKLGADVNVRYWRNQDQTPLHKAAEQGHYDIAKLLIDNGADVNAEDEDRNTPLHEAAWEGYYEVAELLIDKGANVNARNRYGITPLHVAAWEGHYDIAKLLIDKGADVNAEDENWNTPLHRAADEGHYEIAELLIDKGADVNAKDISYQTPLHKAARNGHYQIAKLLIDNGADVNAEDRNTPLHKAAEQGHYDIAKLLIDNGAEVDVKNDNGETPLHRAVLYGHRKIAKLLIDNGADININIEGETVRTLLDLGLI